MDYVPAPAAQVFPAHVSGHRNEEGIQPSDFEVLAPVEAFGTRDVLSLCLRVSIIVINHHDQ